MADTLTQTDPVLLALLGLLALGLVIVLFVLVRRPRAEPGPDPALVAALEQFRASQSELAGRLAQMDEQRLKGESAMREMLDKRLDTVSQQLNTGLRDQTERTQKTLTSFTERLAVIDEAQKNLTDLSSHVIDLQKVLDNKQARGAFGEVQLNNLVSQALPPSAYSFQYTLSNGKRPDCLITLPNPPGPICIDSKFPLEAYSAYVGAADDEARKRALAQFKADVKTHITAIADKYILFGETADSALMFVPSESIYAEIHAGMPDIVEAGYKARVWIASPTTLMALLNTIRAVLKDAEMREQAHRIQAEVAKLMDDMGRLQVRVDNLGRHFGQAQKDVSLIATSTDKILKKGKRIENIELDEPEDDDNILPFDERQT